MTNKQILDTTVDSATYNKALKRHLEKEGEIHCARCKYHKSENYTGKYYGTNHRCVRSLWYDVSTENPRDFLRYPNWKLVSKNAKQWMRKPMKIHKNERHYYDRSFEWYQIEF